VLWEIGHLVEYFTAVLVPVDEESAEKLLKLELDT